MLWLNAPNSLFSLSKKPVHISGLGTGTRLSHADIAHWWLRNEYLARLIITQLKQVVTAVSNAILFQLVYSWTIYTPVCLFLYITLQLELKAQWRLLKSLLTSSICYGKIMTSQYSQ